MVCSGDIRNIQGFRVAELCFGYASLGLPIVIYEIKSLNRMVILLALMVHHDVKFNMSSRSDSRQD